MTDTPDPVPICRHWWEDLKNHTGDRAQLRRCQSSGAALMVPATHWLIAGMTDIPFGGCRDERLAVLAALMARADSVEADKPMAEIMALGDRPALSPLRFRRLLASDDIDELLTQMRRAIDLLDRRVHLPSLVDALRWWSFDATRKEDNHVVIKWACDYFAKAPA